MYISLDIGVIIRNQIEQQFFKCGSRTYLYFCKTVDGNKHELLCGPVGDPLTEQKSQKFQYRDLENQKYVIEHKLKMMRLEKSEKPDDVVLSSKQIKEIEGKMDKLRDKYK